MTWFKWVASGMDFNNAVFHRMVQGILEGKFKFLIATDFTRISRFGIQLIEYLCKLGGCEILYTLQDEADSKDENETLVDDVLSILQHYMSKVTGRKTKLIQELKVEPAVLRRILSLHSEGQSTRAIARLLKRENISGTANGKAREITKTVVNRILKENGPLLKELCKNASSAFSRSNVAEFFAERVRVAAGDVTIRLRVLVSEYRRWSFRRGEVPTANTLALPCFIESHFPTVHKGRLHKGQRFYKGLSLLAEKQ